MRINLRSILIDLVRGGARPHLELERRVSRVVYDTLEPLRVPGLKALESVWVYAPAKKPEPIALLGLRYTAKTQKATCRFLLSPVAPTDDSRRWRVFQRAFLREIESLMLELLDALEPRLRESGRDADLAPARASLQAGFSSLARELAADEGAPSARKGRPRPAAEGPGSAGKRRPPKGTAPKRPPR